MFIKVAKLEYTTIKQGYADEKQITIHVDTIINIDKVLYGYQESDLSYMLVFGNDTTIRCAGSVVDLVGTIGLLHDSD